MASNWVFFIKNISHHDQYSTDRSVFKSLKPWKITTFYFLVSRLTRFEIDVIFVHKYALKQESS